MKDLETEISRKKDRCKRFMKDLETEISKKKDRCKRFRD